MAPRLRVLGGDAAPDDGGGSPQIEVRAVCPKCTSGRYAHNGVLSERIIYRKCLDCGHSGKVEVFQNTEREQIGRALGR